MSECKISALDGTVILSAFQGRHCQKWQIFPSVIFYSLSPNTRSVRTSDAVLMSVRPKVCK